MSIASTNFLQINDKDFPNTSGYTRSGPVYDNTHILGRGSRSFVAIKMHSWIDSQLTDSQTT